MTFAIDAHAQPERYAPLWAAAVEISERLGVIIVDEQHGMADIDKRRKHAVGFYAAWDRLRTELLAGTVTARAERLLVKPPPYLARAQWLLVDPRIRAPLERAPVEVTRDWWQEPIPAVRHAESYTLQRVDGEKIEVLRNIEIALSEIDKVWPKPELGPAKAASPIRADVLAQIAVPPDKPRAKSFGRPFASDWPAIKERLRDEIKAVGFPDKTGAPGWRSQADVVRFVESLTDHDEPGKTALKDNTKRMLEELRTEMDGKSESPFRP